MNCRFLYGGVGKEIYSTVDMIDLTSENMKWQRIPFSDVAPIWGRYGHSTLIYNEKMVIFGGERLFSEKPDDKIICNDLWLFNLSLN